VAGDVGAVVVGIEGPAWRESTVRVTLDAEVFDGDAFSGRRGWRAMKATKG